MRSTIHRDAKNLVFRHGQSISRTTRQDSRSSRQLLQDDDGAYARFSFIWKSGYSLTARPHHPYYLPNTHYPGGGRSFQTIRACFTHADVSKTR
jgi:hypothetical protein